jgi:hypothetical protein
MKLDPLGRYSVNRLFEWVAAGAMASEGLITLIWPRTISAGNFRLLLDLMSARDLTAVYLAVGAVRMFTLVLNGRIGVWGPRIRAVMASISCVIWVQMAFALFTAMSLPSPSIGMLLAFAAGELRSVARARGDLRHGT